MENNKTVKKELYMIDPRNIVVEEGFNSRIDFDLEKLTESIKTLGVKEPVSVIPFNDENDNEKYRLVDGERRYRACMQAIEDGCNIARIPALYLSKSLSPEDLLLEQLVRNEGKPFTDYEFSIACLKFKNFGLTNKEIADKIHKNPGQVTYWLSIQNFCPELKEYFKSGKISYSEFHRMAEAHKKQNGELDEQGLLDEINGAYEKAKKNGKEKITLKDLDVSSKTISFRNSKDIKKGVGLLIDYYNKYSENGKIEFEVDIQDIFDQLSVGMTIDEIFTKEVNIYKKAE